MEERVGPMPGTIDSAVHEVLETVLLYLLEVGARGQPPGSVVYLAINLQKSSVLVVCAVGY